MEIKETTLIMMKNSLMKKQDSTRFNFKMPHETFK